MGNFYSDNEDLQYYVRRGIDWETLVRLTERVLPAPDGPATTAEAVEGYREILDLVGTFVAEQIAPHTAAIDHAGVSIANGLVSFPPQLQGIFDQIRELDLHGMSMPRELGGMNCPVMLYFLCNELIARGDVSVMTHHGFHGAISLALMLYSIAEGSTEFDAQGKIKKTRFAKEIGEIVRGEAWGCMDITEPNAGSDMASLNTKAELQADGSWALTGQKIFITSGHGKYHIVIARSEPVELAPGLAGLSLFLAPAYEQDASGQRRELATVDRIEDKLGHHASATCAITYEQSPAQLLGQRGDGFKNMLLLMNNARLGVGFESLGLCEAALRLATSYARDRQSMGKRLDQHELIADQLDEMATDIQGIRALAMEGAFQEEVASRLRIREAAGGWDDELEGKRCRRLAREAGAAAREITPLLKFLAAEKSVEMARRCLQIHGGVGYTREYGAEKLLRDALVTPIYEGTTQIQALMAMKDALGQVIKAPQAFVKKVAQVRFRSLSARDPLERRVSKVRSVALSAIQTLLLRTSTDKLRDLRQQPLSTWPAALRKNWNPKRDFAFAMLHAERLTMILTDAAICEALWKQAQKHSERREVLSRYLERAEPRCNYLAEVIASTGDRLVARLRPDELPQGDVRSA